MTDCDAPWPRDMSLLLDTSEKLGEGGRVDISSSDSVGGGGGAGGVRTSIPGLMPATDSQITVSPGSPNKVTVTVGAGGVGSPNYSVAPTIGGSSSFGPTTLKHFVRVDVSI